MERAFAKGSFHQLQQMPVEYELCVSLHWLSKLRWIAGAGVLVGTWIAQRMFGVGLQPLPLYIIGASILVRLHACIVIRSLGCIELAHLYRYRRPNAGDVVQSI